MIKTAMSVIIAILFMNLWTFMLPFESYGANFKKDESKPLQYFVNIGKLQYSIKERLDVTSKIDVIVTINAETAHNIARQMRVAKHLIKDNSEIIAEKAKIYKSKKGEILAALSTSEFAVIRDYDNFPVIHMEVNGNTLRQLLHNPDVKRVADNKKSVPFLTESLPLIGVPDANNEGATGAGTSVAVLDSGVDYTRSAFGNCTSPGSPSSCKVAYVQDFTSSDDGSLDDYGHGTQMSGIVVGVAPDTKILGLDVFHKEWVDGGWKWFTYDTDILSALSWVYSNISTYNITAVNMSFGDGSHVKQTSPCPSDNLASAISDLKSAGVLSVISSGNDGFADGITSPACIPDALSVGATYDATYGSLNWCPYLIDYPCPCNDSQPSGSAVVCWSNNASFLTMVAPGATYITAAGIDDKIGGTSAAAAHVSGAIAAISGFTGLSANNIQALLTSTGVPATDAKNNIVKPRLDLRAATPIPCTNPVRIAGGSYYSSLQAAYNDAGKGGNGNTIQATKSIIIGNLDTAENKSVSLQGGYDCNFGSIKGYTYVKGNITGSFGTLTMGNVILMR